MPLYRAISFINYWLDAVGIHSLQSPFLYDLYKDVIKKNGQNIQFPEYEKIREKYKSSDEQIEVTDYGSGSLKSSQNIRQVSDIASYGVSKRRYSELMNRLIDYTDSKQIIELGTSLGLNTLYLANNSATSVVTFEGAESLAKIARKTFQACGKNNIKLITGNIDKTLPNYLGESEPIDFVFLDANHKCEPTIRYFELFLNRSHDETCFVFDDIHLTKEMDATWKAIKNHYRVTVSIDLYQVGLIFINPELTKQHYVLEV